MKAEPSPLQRLVRLLALMNGCILVAWLVTSIYSCQTAKDAESAANRAEKNGKVIALLEQQDSLVLRRAAYRICARDQLDRAEIHSAYAVPIVIPPGVELAVVQLLTAAEEQRKVGLKRVRRNLPILDCKPNLEGKPAVPLSAKRQARYVKRYLKNQLDPTPGGSVTQPIDKTQQELKKLGLTPNTLAEAAPRRPPRAKVRPRQRGSPGGGNLTPTQPRESPSEPQPGPRPKPSPPSQPQPPQQPPTRPNPSSPPGPSPPPDNSNGKGPVQDIIDTVDDVLCGVLGCK